MITYLEAFVISNKDSFSVWNCHKRKIRLSHRDFMFVISANKRTNVSDADSILTCIFENSVTVVIVAMGSFNHPLLKYVLYWETSRIVKGGMIVESFGQN